MCTVPAMKDTTPRATPRFERVGIVARRQREDVVETIGAVAAVLGSMGAELVLESATAAGIRARPGAETATAMGDLLKGPSVDRDRLGDDCDLVVVIGGDGSLLGVSRAIAHTGVPVLGVNRGGLGFLAAVSPDTLEAQLADVWAGNYTIEDHFLLHAQVSRNGEIVTTSNALNDVVVHAGSLARMIEFELWVDDAFVYDQRSDGVIIASPTGSTAYSLSAGGPIMHPSLDAIVIVPMFPHTLTSRPLVIRGDSVTRIRVTRTSTNHHEALAQISCDSQVNAGLQRGDEIVIRKYAKPLRLLYPTGHSFFESCRSKLDWASRLGGQSL